MRPLDCLAVIPDGNRRYAKKHALPYPEAYARGFAKSAEVLEWCREAGVNDVIFWALSLDNYSKREQTELALIYSLFKSKLEEALSDGRLGEARVHFFGRIELLPKDLQDLMKRIEERTRNNKGIGVHFAVAYSGRDEILQACRRYALEAKTGKPDESAFRKYLYSPLYPDLVIRTGSTHRLSGFMPWQSDYSEIFVSDALWPEFTRGNFDAAIAFFKETEARRGR
jgi:undecaprenyl diphosphate synthase